GHGVDAFPAASRSGLQNAIDTQCLVPLGGDIQTNMLHTGDLIDDALRTGLVSCLDGGACTGTPAAYYQFLQSNVVVPDYKAGAVLVVQGLADQIMAPETEAACIVDRLNTYHVITDVCALPFVTHTTVMDNHAKGVAWVESVIAGGARAECDQSA